MKKTASFDIAKFICAFLVISIHTYPLLGIHPTLNLILVSGIARIAVPLFFVISAYFFFQHTDENYVMKYLKKIGKLYLIWSLIYLPFYLLQNSHNGLVIMVVRYLRNFFFLGSHYHLWFLPALMFALYVVNKFSKYFNLKQILMMSAILYFIGHLGNIYVNELYQVPILGTFHQLYMNVFETTRNGLFFGVPFVAMGYLCAQKLKPQSQGFWCKWIMISIVLYASEFSLLCYFDVMNDLSSMYLMLIPLVYGIFRWLQAIELSITPKHVMMRKMSLLIYVSHILFYLIICRVFVTCDYFTLFVITCLLTLGFSSGVIYLAKYLPFLKHLYE